MKRIDALSSMGPRLASASLGMGVLSVAAGLGVALVASGCAGSAPESAQIERVIERAQSGALIEEINQAQEAAPAAGAETAPASKGAAITRFDIAMAYTKAKRKKQAPEFEEFGLEKYTRAKPSHDPCPKVKKSAQGLDAAALAEQAQLLGACLRETLAARAAYSTARAVVKSFELPAGVKLSALSPAEIGAYLDKTSAELSSSDPDQAGASGAAEASSGAAASVKLRSAFTDEALEDLTTLSELHFKSLLDAEATAVAAADARPSLIAKLAESSNRYALLAATAEQFADVKGQKLAAASIKAITGEAAGEELEAVLAKFPMAMLHAYNTLALIPDEGAEMKALTGVGENPLILLLQALGSLEGPEAKVQQTVATYTRFRNLDNPELPVHAASGAQPVRVAVMDSGIDFRNYTDLGLFLGTGRRGELASYDFADGDANPWALGVGPMSHGSGTAATVLTLVARSAPEVLRDRKFEMATWKVSTARELLSGSGAGGFNNRPGLFNAIAENLKAEVKPKIVSVSLGFNFNELNKAFGTDPAILKRVPWLWVMAAGNEGADVTDHAAEGAEAECFADVEAKNRNDARILCVGALVQGIIHDEVASYSNFGPRVDVYAYDSYTQLCPNGTSCATPAVAGAAAVIAAKYPNLPVEKIKQAIVNAAEYRKLSKQPSDDLKTMSMILGVDLPAAEIVTVPVFDPASMMNKALKEAAKLSAAS